MYLLFNLMSRVDEIRSNARGTTYPEINKSSFREMHIFIPDAILINEFDGVVRRIIDQIRCLKKQNVLLTKARDLVLPRLMNGEIQIEGKQVQESK